MKVDPIFLWIGGALFLATVAAFFNLFARWIIAGIRISRLLHAMRKRSPSIPLCFSLGMLRTVGQRMKEKGPFDDEHLEQVRRKVIDRRTMRSLCNAVWLLAFAQAALVVFVCAWSGELAAMAFACLAIFGFFGLFAVVCRFMYGKIRTAFDPWNNP